ncbi:MULTISPECIES: FprA family A-type flavoprotein [unclassified Fusibacter]|uniref:FprA family A-type flavoprotein n=1 Tax=unclassified Fusibacter TaxID=2624464 RepID=UPI00101375FE|nr:MULTISPECIES: FprA family A-type flavoprotein [unclassified Fusibacter]MCK8058285.1 FprA family A-type flavoprotein [Fusibacter sp. A2]NPE20868.1 FprA family A-type flavoprotein [Fusibacter sp. A1]RXV63072.1 FprA family A-type flavoprotein [Fusibacter sp. A1]
MDCRVPITEKIHWIGVNDRETTLFENFWPLEKGVAYNSYLIDDEKVVLVDTVKFNKTDQYIDKIKEIIGDKQVDYLIVNHMEPDHSGSMLAIIANYPNIKIVGNKKTFTFIENFYSIDSKYFYEIGEGDVLDIGHHKLKFYLTPMIHWPETMMTFDETSGALFSMDAFGGFGALDGGIFDDEINYLENFQDETRRYYSNIVAKYSPIVQGALKKLGKLDIKMICPTHGPIWRTNPSKIIDLYDKWSRHEAEEGVVIVYSTMYGNTAKMADYVGRIISENGVKNVRIYDASKTHLSYIISDIWRFKGVILGSCAYNSHIFPAMEAVINKIEHVKLKNRFLGVFGNKSWSGGGVSTLDKFAETIQWEKIGESVEATSTAKQKEFDLLKAMGQEMAARVIAEPK